jgi:hypothetical protein
VELPDESRGRFTTVLRETGYSVEAYESGSLLLG